MNLHEYQAKDIFRIYGIPVPAGRVAATPDEAVAAARALGGQVWLVSPAGAGTTLRAVIPLHGPSATGLVPTGSTPADGAGGDHPGAE